MQVTECLRQMFQLLDIQKLNKSVEPGTVQCRKLYTLKRYS